MPLLVSFVSFYQGSAKVFETQPMKVVSGGEQRVEDDVDEFRYRAKGYSARRI